MSVLYSPIDYMMFHCILKKDSVCKGPEYTLLQGGHTEGPETYEKMLNNTSHQRDAN